MPKVSFGLNPGKKVFTEDEIKGDSKRVTFSTKQKNGLVVGFFVAGPAEIVDKEFNAMPIGKGIKSIITLSTDQQPLAAQLIATATPKGKKGKAADADADADENEEDGESGENGEGGKPEDTPVDPLSVINQAANKITAK